MKITTKLWIGLVILIIFSPFGLILPARFKAGSAWGEWGTEEIKSLVGYIPRGFEKLSKLWNAPLSDYAFKDSGARGLAHLSLAYIVSAVLGIAVVAAVMLLIGKVLSKKGD